MRKHVILALLALVLLGSAALRLQNLEARGMGHTEIYTPNIEVPSDYGEPRARLTLTRSITNSLWEPHPPGWYILMWTWTKFAGTSLAAIRLPAVWFGVLVVFLTFVLGRIETDATTALLGAALVGFNGHQILWSQISRPATLLCALGLLSTILLLLAMRQSSRRYAWCYVAVVLAGVAIEHYFWLLFVGQIVFCFVRYRSDPETAAGLLKYQLFALIAAAPLLPLIPFQGGARQLDANAQATFQDLSAFGFLLEHDLGQPETLVDSLRPAAAVLGAALIILGLWRLRFASSLRETTRRPLSGPPRALAVALVVLGCVSVVAIASYLAQANPAKRAPMLVTVVVPLGAMVGLYFLERYWGLVTAVLDRVMPNAVKRGLPAIVVMLMAPLALATVISLKNPMLVSRHLQMFVPFLLLLMAQGMIRVAAFRPRWVSGPAIAICAASVVGAYVAGYRYQLTAHPGPHDYRGLAEVWIPSIEPSDVILVRDHFRTTPLFYYMKPSRFSFIGLDHVNEIRRRKPPRVWVFWVTGWKPFPAIDEAVAGYHRVSEVTARNTGAQLYIRDDIPR